MSEAAQERPSVLRTARERTRAEITREILDAARRHLASDGVSGLSLRAIARELGMAPSAVYRYVPSRDELLTMLIVNAFDSLGEATEKEVAAISPDDLYDRWSTVCHAVRQWALANPNEYALIYGTRVPGYVTPPDTIAPAFRVSGLLVEIVVDAASTGKLPPPILDDDVAPEGQAALAPLRHLIPAEVSDALLQRGLMAWAALFGTVSFELFGQLHNVVGDEPGDREAFFSECVRRWAGQVGIA
jgi:AcrR family transcriptional regulator